MTRLRPLFFAPLAFVLALAIAPFAYAGPAEDFIRTKHSSLITELGKPATAARNKNVDGLLDNFFDFDRLTKDALATNYDDLTEDEFKELKALVRALVTKNYKKNIEKTRNYQVTFLADNAEGSGRKVRTKVQKRGSADAPVEINYVLHQVNGAWMVYDVETDGSSMLRNYKNQFSKVIRRDGFPALLRKLERKLANT